MRIAKVTTKTLFNPHNIFSICFILELFVYRLEWSTLFPKMTLTLLLFILFAIMLNLILGIVFSRNKLVTFRTLKVYSFHGKVVFFITLLWITQFIYSGIPLVSIVRGIDYNYQDFGIPTIKVFITTLTSFYCTFLTHNYISTKKKILVVYFLFLISFFILAFSRGLFLMTLLPSVLMLLGYKSITITFKRVVIIFLSILLILFIFGYSGNVRTTHQVAIANNQEGVSSYNSEIIVDLSEATYEFKESFIPNEFMWGYVYFASPISNLQYNINIRQQTINVGENENLVITFVLNEFLADFLSKRLFSTLNIKQKTPILLVDFLTVSTVFGGSCVYLGWNGMLFMLFVILIFPIFYLKYLVSPLNPFYISSFCVICCMYFFFFFDNMFVFSGLSFQLIYPIFYSLINKISKFV